MDVYVMKEGQRRGPFQLFRLTEMLEDGELTPQDAVWHEGMEKWQPMQETESLQGVLRKAANVSVAEGRDETAPAATVKPAVPPELTLAVLRQRRALAWRRFFARQIDMTISTAAVIAAAVLMGWGDWWSLYVPESWILILAPALVWILPETVMLSWLGWTPGRVMLGLQVVDKDGNCPTPGAALKRSVLVWAGGYGFGLPALFLPVAQWMYAFWHFQRRGETLWDHSAGTRVTFCQLHRWHVAGIAVFTAAITALFAWILLTIPLPSRFSDEERKQWEKVRKGAWERTEPSRQNSGLPSARGA